VHALPRACRDLAPPSRAKSIVEFEHAQQEAADRASHTHAAARRVLLPMG
jgi:hypothetical protein